MILCFFSTTIPLKLTQKYYLTFLFDSRADLRSTGTHPQNDFGAIDAKLSSYGSLMKESHKNSLTVWAEVGPSHDDQPVFCWSTSPVSPVPPHYLHPDCFNYGFEKLVPAVLD